MAKGTRASAEVVAETLDLHRGATNGTAEPKPAVDHELLGKGGLGSLGSMPFARGRRGG